MPEDLLTAALRYAELGYPVFPCTPSGKTPRTEHGFHDATIDPEQIERWWSQHPGAHIAIPTAGLLVLDIDGLGNSWPSDPDQAADLTRSRLV
ncbi:MAG: bifunctional DNA primase/polymerase [Gemmataceae bacterium]|nr:bifunctional DNA primase/polymerase [Gemmataceae bacterium]